MTNNCRRRCADASRWELRPHLWHRRVFMAQIQFPRLVFIDHGKSHGRIEWIERSSAGRRLHRRLLPGASWWDTLSRGCKPIQGCGMRSACAVWTHKRRNFECPNQERDQSTARGCLRISALYATTNWMRPTSLPREMTSTRIPESTTFAPLGWAPNPAFSSEAGAIQNIGVGRTGVR